MDTRLEAVEGDVRKYRAGAHDALLLDPPRSGFRQVAKVAERAQVRRIVYVSCNPGTLQRDLKALMDDGWLLERVRPYDLFPHTGHVEVLSVLTAADHVGGIRV